jgi:hypothetical protein
VLHHHLPGGIWVKREIGASAGVLALIAVILHTQFPESRVAPSQSGKGAGSESGAHESAAGHRREGPWIATRAFFHTGEPPDAPGARGGEKSPCGEADADASLPCLIQPASPVDLAQLRSFLGAPREEEDYHKQYSTWSLVATVADPVHTRLALFFDRQLEAIQRSLKEANWELAGRWVPWMGRVQSADTDVSERRNQRQLQREQEQLPGVLVFRRFDKLPPRQVLFVFLVPERPTDGISGPPFYAAMRLAHVLSPPQQVGILGPSFSGSFESLAALVLDWNQAHAHDPELIPPGTNFYGGTISSRQSAERFQQTTGMKFSSGIASSADYNDAFCGQFLDAYRVESHEVAFIMEDATAFAIDAQRQRERTKDCPASATYVFPRDISHLRNVYQEQTAAPPPKSPAGEGGVSFTIKDLNSGEDSMPVYSDQQTPLSQNSIVQSIMEDLRRRRIRIAYILATNVLDALFLTQLIRQQAPDTRILTEDPDVLFAAAAGQMPLKGTLFLSSYPMFFEGDQWLDGPRRQRMVFPSPDFEGMFNATQWVLAKIGAGTGVRERGFEHTQQGDARPGLWLLTLNRSGLMPLALMDGKDHVATWQMPPPPRSWFNTALALAAFACWCCFLVVRSNRSTTARWPDWLALGRNPIRRTARLVCILIGCLSLSAIQWFLFLPVWTSRFERLWPWALLASVVGPVAFVLPIGTALWIWDNSRPRHLDTATKVFLTIMCAVFILGILAWLRSCAGAGSAAFFFRFRALQLYSGSSPALPLILLGFTTLAGSLFYVTRLSRAGIARPRLKVAAFGPIAMALRRRYCELNRHISGPAQSMNRQWLRGRGMAVLLMALWVIALQPWKYASAFEHRWYNAALAVAVSFVLFCLLVECYDLWRIWDHLRELLKLIDLMPLRAAFKRVARPWPRRPIWASSHRLSKTAIARQMLAALQERQEILKTDDAQDDVLVMRDILPRRFDDVSPSNPKPRRPGQVTPDTLLQARWDYETVCARLAGKIVEQDLVPAWRDHVYSDPPEPPERETTEEGKLRSGSDFVAIQLARYLIYAVQQAQSVAWCISCCLLLLMLVLNSYAPQAPMLVSRFLAVLFVVAGVVVVRVFAGMERNALLSLIAGTQPGQLNQEFWLRLIGMGILPLLGILSHIFPSIADTAYSLLAPGVDAMH